MERSQISVLFFGTLILSLLFVSALADDDVFVLTEANFEKEVGQERDALVEFYAPWYPLISSFFENIKIIVRSRESAFVFVPSPRIGSLIIL